MGEPVESFNKSINNFTNNKYAVTMSNFPNLSEISDKEIDLTVFSTKVQEVQLPNKEMRMLKSLYNYEEQQHPNTTGAREKNVITITWILDDKFMNYYLMDQWMRGTKFGIPARSRDDGSSAVRDNCIDVLDVYALDNTKIPSAKLSFYRCFLTGLGAITLKNGEANITTFETTFEYERDGIQIQRTKEDGSLLIEPLRTIMR